MYFQLEVYYNSNKTNKNKYKKVKLTSLTKNNLKLATDCNWHSICYDDFSYLLLGLQSTLLIGLGVA